jgi:hypothetical protein
MEFYNQLNKKSFGLKLKNGLRRRLEATKTHRESEALARELYKTNYCKLFDLSPKTQYLRPKTKE